MHNLNASSHVPIFHPGHFVIFFLPEPIPAQDYRERYRKGRAPYVHANIEPESRHEFPFTDGARVRSIGTIVQHTSRTPNVELHMVNRDGHKFVALVATRDIYAGDELLLKFQRGIHNEDYQVDQTDQGVSYKTKQMCCKVQHLWTQNRDKSNPHDPVVKGGEHVGQKYDKRYTRISGIPH